MRMPVVCGCMAAVAFSLRAEEAKPQEMLVWRIGVLKGSHIAKGAETTGWTIEGLDVEPGSVDLRSRDGSRVAILGRLGEKKWAERGMQPILRAERVERVRKEEDDLIVRGKVTLLEGQEMERARVGVWLTRLDGARIVGSQPPSVAPANDGAYELCLPALLDEFAGWRYHWR